MLFPYPYLPDPGNVKSVDIDIEGMDHLLMEMEYDSEIKMRDYKFNGTSINMVSGIQTWGGFFFEQMVWVEVR